MFLGAMLDGLPEAFVLGIGIAVGGEVSAAFVLAVFVSNVPQGVAGTTSLVAAGHTQRQVFWLWGGAHGGMRRRGRGRVRAVVGHSRARTHR